MSEASNERDGRTQRRTPATWIRVAASKTPATWLTVSATALFLGVTAAFGGLADAPVAAAPQPTALGPGQTHSNQQFDIRLERAVLIDELPGSGTTPEEGERVLAITATLTNVADEPLLSSQFADGTFSVERMPTERPGGSGPTELAIARLDDGSLSPWLQPDVPVDVVLTWPVPAALFAEDDTLRVTLSDFDRYVFARLGGSEDDHTWIDPTPAAHVDLPTEDVGAGVEQDGEG